jgi:uncharacterized membrane protein
MGSQENVSPDISSSTPPLKPISLRFLEWLQSELGQWSREGLVSPEQVRAILARYESAELLKNRGRSLIFFTLCGLAILLAAAGVLLLIGFNWDRIPRNAKVAMIFSLVAASFSASAWTYVKDRVLVGELLAFAGVLSYGCAIWLLAQAFHIQSHYPDGALWWLIGTLLVAWTLNSGLIAITAVTLLTIWTGMEIFEFHNPNYGYWLFAVVLFVLTYRVKWNSLLALSIISLVLWMIFNAANTWHSCRASTALFVLLGCVLYAAGGLHLQWVSFAKIYQAMGLLVLLIPLTIMTVSNGPAFDSGSFGFRFPYGLAFLFLAFLVLVSVLKLRKEPLETLPFLVVAVFAFLQILGVVRPGEIPNRSGDLLLIVANLFLVWIGVTLIVQGIRKEWSELFFAGVIYILVFLVARWLELFGDMVSTALLFFLVAAGFLGTALFWRNRQKKIHRQTEVTHV